MDEDEDGYRFDCCDTCFFRDESLGLCDSCDEGDMYEEDWEADSPESKRKVIPILEAA